MRFALSIAASFVAVTASAQPLIDLFSVNAMGSPGLDRLEIGAAFPLKLDTAGRLLVIEPYWVQWRTTTAGEGYAPVRAYDVQETMQGSGGALTFVSPIGKRWKLAGVGILRYHWLGDQRHGAIQPGGALLVSRVLKPSLTLRLGTYVNHDAFGWFVMPLLGIDWRINAKTNLYGTLPGSLTFERRSARWFHWGLSFRAYTTSFGVRSGDYRRINENPAGLYADLYATRSIVLRAEAGWCFIRQVLGGPDDPLFANADARRRDYADHRIADAAYARLVLAYRFRLDGEGK